MQFRLRQQGTLSVCVSFFRPTGRKNDTQIVKTRGVRKSYENNL